MGLTTAEQTNREMLQGKKPRVFDKVITHADKITRKESVAMIQLQYRYDCNFKCKHCAIERLKDKPNGRLLTLEDVRSIGDQADAMGLASFCVSGGEPIIFPDLKDVVNALGPDRFNIAMDTNGWLLTPEKIRFIQSIGIDRIQLSVDNLHDKGSRERAIKTLKMCQAEGLRVIINVVVTKTLVASGELLTQVSELSRFGEHISLIAAKPVGAFENEQDEILDTRDFLYIQEICDYSHGSMSTHQSPNCGHSFGCFAFKRWFSITAYGDVMPCPWIPISFGNIHDTPLAEIVDNGLKNKWFSYDRIQHCLAGNRDLYFYRKILPQIDKASTYPAPCGEINW